MNKILVEVSVGELFDKISILEIKKDFDKKKILQSGLLSLKQKIFVCNVDEQSLSLIHI